MARWLRGWSLWVRSSELAFSRVPPTMEESLSSRCTTPKLSMRPLASLTYGHPLACLPTDPGRLAPTLYHPCVLVCVPFQFLLPTAGAAAAVGPPGVTLGVRTYRHLVHPLPHCTTSLGRGSEDAAPSSRMLRGLRKAAPRVRRAVPTLLPVAVCHAVRLRLPFHGTGQPSRAGRTESWSLAD